MKTGRLFLVATPIGNLADLSERAQRTLAQADRILAEDTRRARTLLSRIGVATRPLSLHAHNEAARTPRVRRWLARGEDIALISDAGTPLLSDPGERLVAAAVEDGAQVAPVPGPSAILAALAVSGLPCVPFTFRGFAPRKAGARARALEAIIDAAETTVLFESPGRLAALLAELDERLRARPDAGERRVAVCRELTKLHEEIFRGTAAEAARRFGERTPRGEVTVVVEGRRGRRRVDPAELDSLARQALAAGLAPTAAAREVAARSGATRSEAYDAVRGAGRGRSSADPAGPKTRASAGAVAAGGPLDADPNPREED